MKISLINNERINQNKNWLNNNNNIEEDESENEENQKIHIIIIKK